jgi:methionyl-tRNA synthetase
MIARYFPDQALYPSPTARKPADDEIAALARKTIADYNSLADQCHFSRALDSAWSLVAAVNKYIVENEPWTLGEQADEMSRSRLGTILYTSAEAVRIVTLLVHPVIPDSTARIWAQFGLGDIRKVSLVDLEWGQLRLGAKLGKIAPVFPRADKTTIERMRKMEEHRQPAAAPAKAKAEPATPGEPAAPATPSSAPPAAPRAVADQRISLDDFAKVELRVGQVKVAEKVRDADKLLRLEVDLGSEVRQVVAGIAEAYAPETLIGRKVVLVANLAPRKLRGLESNGMIVAASPDGGKPVLCSFLEDVPIGSRLK